MCVQRTRPPMDSTDSQKTDWLLIIRGEYLEIPGLNLTKPQIERLWGLDTATCQALLDSLVSSRFLRRTARNGYVRDEG
jgi:hypothetical protein